MTAAEQQPEPTIELWYAAGYRMAADGTKASAWVDPGGNLLLYSSRRAGRAIGGVYEATVVRHDDDQVTLHGSPLFKHTPADAHPDKLEWEAASHACVVEAQRRSDERAAQKVSALDDALAPLLELARKARTGRDRDALIATVIRRMSGAW